VPFGFRSLVSPTSVNWMKAGALCCIGALSACATAPKANVVQTGLPSSENFRVQRSQSASYDFIVSIKNGRDLGINADDQAARDRMALLALKNQCEAPQIIRETVAEGSLLFGSPERVYQLEVKC
jgi:hypothetical protein